MLTLNAELRDWVIYQENRVESLPDELREELFECMGELRAIIARDRPTRKVWTVEELEWALESANTRLASASIKQPAWLLDLENLQGFCNYLNERR